MAQTKSKTKSKPTSKRKSTSSSKPSSARKQTNSSSKAAPTEAMSNAAGKATTAVGHAADKAKIPLMAGGAAITGAAGGAALAARQARRKKSTAVRLGEFALQMQRARQTPNGAKHRSPVEVVLEGLTSRRSRA